LSNLGVRDIRKTNGVALCNDMGLEFGLDVLVDSNFRYEVSEATTELPEDIWMGDGTEQIILGTGFKERYPGEPHIVAWTDLHTSFPRDENDLNFTRYSQYYAQILASLRGITDVLYKVSEQSALYARMAQRIYAVNFSHPQFPQLLKHTQNVIRGGVRDSDLKESVETKAKTLGHCILDLNP